MPDILPIGEAIAKGIRHVGGYLADAISERRNAFSDDEDGDYLRCAGADALAEALGTHDPLFCTNRWPCEQCGAPFSAVGGVEPTVCYFCDRPTDRTVVTDYDDTEYVCERCADVATSTAVAPAAAVDPAGGDLAPTPDASGAASLPGHPNVYVVTEQVMEAIHLLHDAGISPQLYQLLNPEK